MKSLTRRGGKPHNGRTTIVNGNTAPRKHRGFFSPGFRHRGPLTHKAGTGTRQFSRIGARSTPGDKAACRTNNRGRLTTVVEPLRLPFPGGASIEIRLGATAMQHPNTQNTPKATPGRNSVRFGHAEGGAIAINGTTGITSLLRLGALVKTGRYRPEIGGSIKYGQQRDQGARDGNP